MLSSYSILYPPQNPGHMVCEDIDDGRVFTEKKPSCTAGMDAWEVKMKNTEPRTAVNGSW